MTTGKKLKLKMKILNVALTDQQWEKYELVRVLNGFLPEELLIGGLVLSGLNQLAELLVTGESKSMNIEEMKKEAEKNGHPLKGEDFLDNVEITV